MAKINEYRRYVREILTEHSHHKPAYGEVDVETIFDIENDRYQVVSAGWNKHRRVYGCLIHIDLKNDKIWIQYDGTEIGIANELVERGVPNQDIILAYHAPYLRHLTDFAIS